MTSTTERQQFEEWFTNKYPRSYWGVEKTASGEYQGGLAAPLWEAWQESRGCMANREAQPVVVAWQHKGEPWRIILDRDIEEVRKSSGSWSPLYTAPPAPANANAVAWEMRYWNSGHNCWHDWERITAEQHAEMSVEHATDNDYEFRVLYDAPLAPAVPDALEKMRSIVADPRALPRRKEWISGQQYSYVLLENVEAMVDEACRAAMLKGERP